MSKVISVSIRSVIATGIISVCMMFSPPGLAQEGEAEGESILIESTIVGDVDPSAAVTVDNLSIPLDQLELLVKPLTVEELQTEAAAWLLLLQDKVKDITQTEIAIKREDFAIELKEEAATTIEDAQDQLKQAESALAKTSSGTPEHEKATKELEEAKRVLLEAQQTLKAAVETGEDLQEDEALKETIEEAEIAEKITTAREVLEDALTQRDELDVTSQEYDALTEQIETLELAFIDFETAEADLESAVPGSAEFQEFSKTVEEARNKVIQAAGTFPDSPLAPSATPEGAVESEDTEGTLEEIATDLEAVEAQAEDAANGAGEVSEEQLEEAVKQLEAVAETEGNLKEELLVKVTELQGDRVAIVDRFNIILDALEERGGDTASYRKYVDAVSGIELDITDTEGLGVRLVSWLKSEEGGIRVGLSLAKCIGILIAAAVLSHYLSKVTNRVLEKVGGISILFRNFLVMVVNRGILVVGVLLALASLGVSLGPVLALVGGASFVLAFALQSNLGNFASGLMLLINKPFDVGDEVSVAGYWAYVDSISLASTKLKTFGGDIVTLPNNTVWGSDIKNHTHSDIRKIYLSINIKFTEDLDRLLSAWNEVAASHPKVLKNPAPGSFPWSAQYDYYIGIGLSAWTKTDGYWSVYVDLLKMLQELLADLDIELAAPQQEIKLSQLPENGAQDTQVSSLKLPASDAVE